MSTIKRLALACLAVGTVATLSGCADDYGYGGPAVGYGAGYDGYYAGYADPYYGGDYSYGYPGYYGWYGGFYYPGSGFYVYDRYRRPYRWNGDQRRYWQRQSGAYRGSVGAQGFRGGSANWGGFERGSRGGTPPSGQAFRGNGGFTAMAAVAAGAIAKFGGVGPA